MQQRTDEKAVDDRSRPALVKAQPEIELRVASGTNVHDLATSIIRNIDEGKLVVLSTIGVGAQAQATKAVIIANQKLSAYGKVLVRIDEFGQANIDEQVERTTIRMPLYMFRRGIWCDG